MNYRDSEIEAMLMPYADTVRKYGKLSTSCLIAGILVLFLGTVTRVIPIILVGLAAVVLGFVFGTKSSNAKKQYDALFKQHMGGEIEDVITSFFGPQLEQRAKETGAGAAALQRELQEKMINSGLFTGWNRCRLDSYRKGIWKGIVFEAFNANLTLEETEANEDASVRTTQILKGIWVNCETGLTGIAPVTIVSKSIGFKLDPAHRVLTDNAEFDEKFCVYAENAEAAEAVLSSRRIEHLLALCNSSDTEIAIKFEEGKAAAALRTGKRFQDMAGSNSEHLENIRQNLKASMEYMVDVMECFV